MSETDRTEHLARTALQKLIGKTIAAIELSWHDGDANDQDHGGSHDTLEITTTDGTSVRLRTQDSEQYSSWLQADA